MRDWRRRRILRILNDGIPRDVAGICEDSRKEIDLHNLREVLDDMVRGGLIRREGTGCHMYSLSCKKSPLTVIK